MASVSSEDDFDRQSERFESYSLSADVSEWESSSTFSYDPQLASSSITSSPLAGPNYAANLDFGDRHVVIPANKHGKLVSSRTDSSGIELMKERFAKLLLGEDMSGGGKGVCTALAISNAITNLYATVFGELWKLEPLAPQKKLMWRREMEWLLCVSDSIVELIPSLQEFPDGGTFEIMVTQHRLDLYVNLPALKKLDAMLIGMLDGFCDPEFHYVDRGIVINGGENIEANPVSLSSGMPSIRLEEKWWLPFPKVPSNGLSEDTRKKLQKCRECTSQIFKAATAINSSILADMEIPNIYLESLPKSGKTCLGEILYKILTSDQYSPEYFLDYVDLSSEYTTLEITNRIEAAIHIWRQKYLKRHLECAKPLKSSWGGKVKGLVADTEKSKLLAERAETLLQSLKLQFPGLRQTDLDMNKIQYNKDVGKSILESYSRVMVNLAFNIMARIDDLLYVNDATKQRAALELVSMPNRVAFTSVLPVQNRFPPIPFSIRPNSCNSPLAAPVPIGSLKQKLESLARQYCSANKSHLWESLDGNLERLTF